MSIGQFLIAFALFTVAWAWGVEVIYMQYDNAPDPCIEVYRYDQESCPCQEEIPYGGESLYHFPE